MSDQMSCAEAEPLLPLVADGALDPDSDPSLFAHLAGCPGCQRLVAQHDLIGLAIRQAGPTPAPRARIIRLWPWAAAATLAAATGLYLAAGPAAPAAPAPAIAATPAPAPAPAIAAEAPAVAVEEPPATDAATDVATAPAADAPAGPDVIALRRGDGSAVYLVRQGEGWVAVDPAAMDGPGHAAHGGGSGVQVRY